MPRIRINRALAAAGVASRRKVESLVRAGRIKLNGITVDNLAAQVDLEQDRLTLDGKRLNLATNVYYLYYKPRGIISTQHDERGRPCVGDICGTLKGTPHPVGRLDRPSEGLMLLTNDGEVANRLMHPRYGNTKEYRVTVEPCLSPKDANQMTAGVELSDGRARFDEVLLSEGKGRRKQMQVPAQEPGNRSALRITVSEGRNRLIRRVCGALGYKVKRLKRTRLGPLKLSRLAVGDVRELTDREAANLRKALGLK